jgi:hypothetical protein
VISDCEVPVEVDGELIGRINEVDLLPARRKLRVVAPENSKDNFFVSVVKTIVNLPRKK